MNNKIPKQLCKPDFGFVLLGKWNEYLNKKTGEKKTFYPLKKEELNSLKKDGWLSLGKAPFEPSWQMRPYKYDDPKVTKHIEDGNNIGVIGGYGNLRILDIDDKNSIPLFENIFKDTFSVTTGSGGKHYYFISDYNKNHTLADGKGELRAHNSQVVCAGSKHPLGTYYIEENKELKTFSIKDIAEVMRHYASQSIDSTSLLDEKQKDTSRSAFEYKRILALIREGKTKEEIFSEMLRYAKWSESASAYREFTYNKAKEYVTQESRDKIRTHLESKEVGFLFSEFNHKTDFYQIVKHFLNTQPVYYDNSKLWWAWNFNTKSWKTVDEIDLLNIVDKYTQHPSTNPTIKNEILEAFKRLGRQQQPQEPNKEWIQFKNTIINYKTLEKINPSPKYFITNPIPWNIGETEDTPNLDRILHEWVEEKYVKTLKEILAYCTLTHMPIHRIFCLAGGGLNGKGSFLRFIEKFVGHENSTSTSILRLTKSNFENSKLYKKLVAIIGEIDKDIFKETAYIKALSGDDLIPIEFKGKDSFDTHNYAKPIIATNKLPDTTDKTKGFYRRWTIVDFNNEFNEKKDILKEIPDIEIENFCSQVPEILNSLLANGAFENDGDIETREERYKQRSSVLYDFIKLNCDISNPTAIIPTKELYVDFLSYLEERGYKEMTANLFGKKLSELGYQNEIKLLTDDYGQKITTRCRRGIALKPKI